MKTLNSKQLFLSKQNFIDLLFEIEPEGGLVDHFGVEFRGLNDITHNDEDDGEFAGSNFYTVEGRGQDNFPKKFPCIVVCYELDERRFISSVIYPEDFKIIS